MLGEPSSKRLASLLSRLVDGLLDDAGHAELEVMLRRSRAARNYYRRYLATHQDLVEYGKSDAATIDFATISRPRRMEWLAAAAGLMLAIGLAWWWLGIRTHGTGEISPIAKVTPTGPVLAVISRADNVRWNLENPPDAGIILHGTLVKLTEGTLALNLVGGQTVTVRAPASFALIDSGEMRLEAGDVALMKTDGKQPYIIRVPEGAVVDLGTEFSVNVGTDGSADVWVFEGQAAASATDASGRTRTDRILNRGDSVRIATALEASPAKAGDFVRPLATAPIDRSPAGDRYADAIAKSGPKAWWRFEEATSFGEISGSAGSVPLELHGRPTLVGPKGHRFLYTDTGKSAGFAMAKEAITGLDRAPGFTVECVLHPATEDYFTALAIDEPEAKSIADISPPNVRHPPQRLVIERMRHSGDHIGHVHPDFALRAMMRSPAGYIGGINTYSSESHIIHRWVHVVFTFDGATVRLYINGRLSDETPAALPFQGVALRPIIGRLQPEAGEQRQWIGGIDEVALYDRPLTTEEILAHSMALER